MQRILTTTSLRMAIQVQCPSDQHLTRAHTIQRTNIIGLKFTVLVLYCLHEELDLIYGGPTT